MASERRCYPFEPRDSTRIGEVKKLVCCCLTSIYSRLSQLAGEESIAGASPSAKESTDSPGFPLDLLPSSFFRGAQGEKGEGGGWRLRRQGRRQSVLLESNE